MEAAAPRARPDIATLALRSVGVLGTLATFALNYRFVLQQLSNGPYLLDAGWFAYLLGAGDLALHNPSAIGGGTFYSFHLSPYLGLLSLAFHALGIDGFRALALSEGVMFAGLTALLAFMALRARPASLAALVLTAAIGFSLLGNITLQIASYPHFEIAFVTLGLLGAMLTRTRQPLWAILPLGLLCLVREDGGLYAALFLLASSLIFEGLPATPGAFTQRLAVRLAAGTLVGAALTLAIKQIYFGQFSAFTADFSGDGWRQLSLPFVGQRLLAVVVQPQWTITLAVTVVLGRINWRYLVFLLLISPLLILQIIAVRPSIGRFELYYAIPWLIIWVGLFLAAYARSVAQQLRRPECLILFVGAMMLTTPIPAALGIPTAWFVARDTVLAPTVDLAALRTDVERALSGRDKICVSPGISGVAPDAVRPAQILRDEPELSPCGTVFLYRGEMGYPRLKRRLDAAAFDVETVLAERVEIYRRQNKGNFEPGVQGHQTGATRRPAHLPLTASP